jgi:hypothetical protein
MLDSPVQAAERLAMHPASKSDPDRRPKKVRSGLASRASGNTRVGDGEPKRDQAASHSASDPGVSIRSQPGGGTRSKALGGPQSQEASKSTAKPRGESSRRQKPSLRENRRRLAFRSAMARYWRRVASGSRAMRFEK